LAQPGGGEGGYRLPAELNQTGFTLGNLPCLNGVGVCGGLGEAGNGIGDGLVVLNPVVLAFEDDAPRYPGPEHLRIVQRQVLKGKSVAQENFS
jgi:hypothetical protein